MVCCSWNYEVSELHLSSNILKTHSAYWVSFCLQVQTVGRHLQMCLLERANLSHWISLLIFHQRTQIQLLNCWVLSEH
jgi:hypothetical protein